RHTGDNPFDDAQPFGDSSSATCFARSGLCSANVLVGESWINLFLQGATTSETTTDAEVLASASPVLSAITERVAEAAASNTVPTVEAVSARTDCERMLPAEIVQSIFATPELPKHSEYHSGGWGLVTGAADLAGVTRCMAGPAASDAGDAQLEMLPHGAWAFEQGSVSTGVWDNHEPVNVDGVDQQAYMTCPVGEVSACTVDFVAGDAWVRVGTFINGQRPVEGSDEPKVLELAGHVASALR
ncbi:MAG TPA: hypothetical protein VGP24_16845, partial [Glaciihabitans sp.]|nr:hypothetical protein [Glaciihabitans sp.]